MSSNVRALKYIQQTVYHIFIRALIVFINIHSSYCIVAKCVSCRLSKIFETFDIRSDLNFSNTQNSRSEHIWTLNFSIRFDSLRTSNILDISNIFDTLARTDFWVELGWIGCADWLVDPKWPPGSFFDILILIYFFEYETVTHWVPTFFLHN